MLGTAKYLMAHKYRTAINWYRAPNLQAFRTFE